MEALSKGLKDGINPGTIRSPRGNSELDTEIPAEVWCQRVGHKPRKFVEGTFCMNCWEELSTNRPDGQGER